MLIKREIGDFKKDLHITTQKIQSIELKQQDSEREIQQLKEEDKSLQTCITTLEIKCHLRLKGIPEDKDENIFKVVVDKLANFLGEQSEDNSYNFETIYRVNSSYATQKQLPGDVVVR